MAGVLEDKTVERLIELYKEHEFLWNSSHPDHQDERKTVDALIDIAVEAGVHPLDVENILKDLHSRFFSEYKKKSSSWFAYDAMKFLLKAGRPSALKMPKTPILQVKYDYDKKTVHAYCINNKPVQFYIRNPLASLQPQEPPSSPNEPREIKHINIRVLPPCSLRNLPKPKSNVTSEQLPSSSMHDSSDEVVHRDHYAIYMSLHSCVPPERPESPAESSSDDTSSDSSMDDADETEAALFEGYIKVTKNMDVLTEDKSYSRFTVESKFIFLDEKPTTSTNDDDEEKEPSEIKTDETQDINTA